MVHTPDDLCSNCAHHGYSHKLENPFPCQVFGCTCAEFIEKKRVILPKPRIPDFIETLDKMKELHLKKNEDYATEENPFANFDLTEYVLKHFKSDRDKSFAWPIACKLARLANLLEQGKVPNNESIEDSFDDIAVYTILWKCDVLRRSKK